jgi:hypothetical protein
MDCFRNAWTRWLPHRVAMRVDISPLIPCENRTRCVMAMTEDERRQLAAIEWELTHDQPKLAKRLARLSRNCRPAKARSLALILLSVTVEVAAVVTMALARPAVGVGSAIVVAAMPVLWLAVAQHRGFSLWRASASRLERLARTRKTRFR